MSEPKLISPLLDNYVMGDPISEKLGIRCCPALERDSQKKCIVKIISTPTSQSQLDALLLSGAYADAQSALQYFQKVAEGIIDEAKILQRLSQLEGFFPYINWQLVPMTDGVGFDVYTLSEYRTTLSKLLRGDNLTHLSAVNLGLDMCTALAVCRRIGYLYVNLKPENIYKSDNNTWKIGDMGFIRLDSLKYSSLPERYRSEYTAPEINDAFASLNTTLDVYSLGLVLYRIYNANQLPENFGSATSESLPPPDYADYEMSEIILKACNPDPEKRWQDPIEMGQALVSYMQRNDVNDTPIVPAQLAVDTSPIVIPDEEIISQDPPALADTPSEVDQEARDGSIDEITDDSTQASVPEETSASEPDNDTKNISIFLTPANDETAPEHNEDQLENITVTDEVSRMLSQADDLIAHPAPDMSSLEDNESTINAGTVPEASVAEVGLQTSAEEPVDEPSPVGDTAEDSECEPKETNTEASATPSTEPPSEHPAKQPGEAAEIEAEPLPDETSESQPDEDLPTVTGDEDDTCVDIEENPEEQIVAKQSHWLRNLLIGTALVILALLVFLFYTKYYLQTIDALSVVKSADGKVSVNISTQTDESKLTVTCSDAYGNPRTSTVKNGIAVFENLAPGTAYTIKIEIDGFHSLVGKTTTAFTTPNQMQILQFGAVTGSEDGSVILSFTTKDQDSENWSVSYTADDGSQTVENFSGHSHTIQGLTVGNAYTFKLYPEENIKYSGTTEVTHTAAAVITPEDLHIQSIADGKLITSWSSPEGATVEKWTVHCYGDKGFDQTVVVDATTAVIEGVDTTEAYTVEVAAIGMSVTAHASTPANAVAVTNFKAEEDGKSLVITWETADATAQSGWVLVYSIDGSEPKELQSGESNCIILEDRIPGATYAFRLKNPDGSEPLGGRMSFNTSAAEKFSGYRVKAADMRFRLCRTPNKSNWSKKDLAASDYTSTFKPGEKASFLVELNTTYNTSKDSVTTMFVIRDDTGKFVDYSTSTRTWTQMWYKGLCELDIPSIPSTAGEYTVSIYMNGMFAGESNITIK